MKLVRQLSELPEDFSAGAVTIGNFDGVHVGHAVLIRRLVELAAAKRGPATVFTFDPHPVRLLRPELAPPALVWTERKAKLLGELGVDTVIAFPTSRELLQLSADQFLQSVVFDGLRAQAVVEGPNFYFGKDRQGDVVRLETLCRQANLDCQIVKPEVTAGQLVSSSRIRAVLADGQIENANAMLVRPYRIRGSIAAGAGRGASIGFATANLERIDTLLPKPGVYAATAFLGETPHLAAVNIGPNPTFQEQQFKVEVHLLDFDRNIYGESLQLDFHSRLRSVVPFGSVDQLVEQIQRDVAETRRRLTC
ncbi:MAG: bifunctional riboflavin kinase/FAD synthetase [Planctomycetales bacterium]|nr:bifunctional riboflavin kinase/FAD synthetase [Planctomycetales bacterium]